MSSEGTPLRSAGSKADKDLKPGFTFEEMWAAIDALELPEKRNPDEFTVTEYAGHLHVNVCTARARLNRLVKAGLVERRVVHRQLAYYRVKGRA